MLWPGLHIRGRSLLSVLILATLSGIVLLILSLLKKKITMDKGLTIYSLIKAYGFNDILAMFVTSQAAHETAGFTSQIYISNHNAFGMKFVNQALSIGEKNGYANYKTIDDSVADFTRWYIKARTNVLSLPLFINSLDSYVSFLKNRNYFEDAESNYLSGCKYFYNQLFG